MNPDCPACGQRSALTKHCPPSAILCVWEKCVHCHAIVDRVNNRMWHPKSEGDTNKP